MSRRSSLSQPSPVPSLANATFKYNNSKDWSKMSINLVREAGCVPWGFSLIRFPDTPSSPITISKVCSLSSASDAGLKHGDVLLSVNDKSIAGKNLQSVTELISRDPSNQLNLGVARPTSSNPSNANRPLSPSVGITVSGAPPANATYFQQQPLPTSHKAPPASNNNNNTMPYRGLDPHSAIDQETALFEEQRREEQQAIKTTPYRSQAVVSPKPKVRHDHPTGCYLQMQHYGDAPNFPSPVPLVGPGRPGQGHGHHGQHEQARLNEMIHQIGFNDPNTEIRLPYNTPLGLYSNQNAMSELSRNSPQLGHSVTGSGGGGQYNYQQHQQQQQSRPVPVRLAPDQLVDGSDFARNLASSPTCQLVLERDGPGRNMDAISPQVYSPVPSYVMDENGSAAFSDTFSGRSTPQQSHTFKVLQNSLLAHPKV